MKSSAKDTLFADDLPGLLLERQSLWPVVDTDPDEPLFSVESTAEAGSVMGELLAQESRSRAGRTIMVGHAT
jgi:hypothetical protein